jgi:hypothetical protein
MIPFLLSITLLAGDTTYCAEVAEIIMETPDSLLTPQEKRQLLSDLPDECSSAQT